ncbi:D-2-hydroxyglutarate--pyruvate transhydrogenase DLD2-like [Copidosoma floridanum]|uniref:D-2-hydroxyglutarate--pyruvate transhydrogenase DLD2-like n=1 Tax=Copidosoma floridanum TaxID=29053 RepID=UPI0006C9D24B|nr:D-2-hydroxyglutarate--pyruvate transhydrogenase DLD2-like [Copidosoma floridanum]
MTKKKKNLARKQVKTLYRHDDENKRKQTPGLRSFDNVLRAYKLAKHELGEILSSCELIDRASMDNINDALGLRSPLGTGHEFHMLIETAGSQLAHDEEKVAGFLEKVMEQGIVDDGTVTSEPSKVQVCDSNVHVQVSTPDYDPKVFALVEPYIFEETSKLRGSISAEHGIGFKKAKYLGYSKDESAIELMRVVKQTMDPNRILNPYKVVW